MADRVAPAGMAVPVGQYSHAIKISPKYLVFVAGQVPIDKDGNVVGKGNIVAQTEQVFANMKAVLKAAGGTIDDLVMTTTYIVDRKYREGYNEVRKGLYKKDPPTSTLVIVTGLADPDYLIEIAGIAVIK